MTRRVSKSRGLSLIFCERKRAKEDERCEGETWATEERRDTLQVATDLVGSDEVAGGGAREPKLVLQPAHARDVGPVRRVIRLCVHVREIGEEG